MLHYLQWQKRYNKQNTPHLSHSNCWLIGVWCTACSVFSTFCRGHCSIGNIWKDSDTAGKDKNQVCVWQRCVCVCVCLVSVGTVLKKISSSTMLCVLFIFTPIIYNIKTKQSLLHACLYVPTFCSHYSYFYRPHLFPPYWPISLIKSSVWYYTTYIHAYHVMVGSILSRLSFILAFLLNYC